MLDGYEQVVETDLKYSKKRVSAAGKTLIDPLSTKSSLDDAVSIIDYWRSLHAYPLTLIMQLLSRLKEDQILPGNMIIAQRLKTRASIMKKLRRQPSMQLSRMYDIAGCRVIVDTVEDVYDVVSSLNEIATPQFYVRDTNDYMEIPKEDGYRCYHYICQCKEDPKTNNLALCVEIQIRTRLQHLWATAVETMSLYTHTDLKASEGPEYILRFFKLSAALFAIDEHTSTVPNMPDDRSDIYVLIRELDQSHKILEKLRMFSVITAQLDGKNSEAGYYVLELDYSKRKLGATFFPEYAVNKASKHYSELEEKYSGENISVVLIATSSFNELKLAYPNYFADIREFSAIVEKAKWNPEFMHCDNVSSVNLRKSISNQIEQSALSLKDKFIVTSIQKNSESTGLNGIGVASGNVYIALGNGPRLSDCYLRFSGIRVGPHDSEEFEIDHLPMISGNAILLSSLGGSYLIRDSQWYIAADYLTHVIEARESTSQELFIMLFLWLKSSLHYWYRMWSRQGNIKKSLIPKALEDALQTEKFGVMRCLLDDLIDMEDRFITKFIEISEANFDEQDKLIKEHNKNAEIVAAKLDDMIMEILGVDSLQCSLIREDLEALEVYQYHV